MTPHKHAEAAIHYFNGGQIEVNSKENAADDDPLWAIWRANNAPAFFEHHSYRIHDPYRELKKRFREGALIQCTHKSEPDNWTDVIAPIWSAAHLYCEKPEKRKIDWSKMPVDTRCNVDYEELYFAEYRDDALYFFTGGKTSYNCTERIPVPLELVQLLPQDWKVWFGGECPVPEGVVGNVLFWDRSRYFSELAKFNWKYSKDHTDGYDIIAYQITGLAEGWAE